jgi:hypothetical protein
MGHSEWDENSRNKKILDDDIETRILGQPFTKTVISLSLELWLKWFLKFWKDNEIPFVLSTNFAGFGLKLKSVDKFEV